MTERPTRWQVLTGGTGGREYAERFATLAADGRDTHGEAAFCAGVVPVGARILDAGCGTGRVAIRLAALGYAVTGIDVDGSMLEVAREEAPDLPWLLGDLADLPGETPTGLDLVVVAGNVVPLLAEGTLEATVAGLAEKLAAGGWLVAGFGLDRLHLPRGCPVTSLADYDQSCRTAGLELHHRFATWDRDRWDEGGYAVSVHRRLRAA